ncbi:carbohydrate porin [Rhodothermus profundi]|uniref:Porin n=1 Tax=Rhodothermus profundi TaxID=633813 RepID=A0A1M6WCB6_9BACT|nr:carbohydrate porin [Rhodothermus profundi]SHK91288.1 porin [Rhodothermus profundi]
MLALVLGLGGWLLTADTSQFPSKLSVTYTVDLMSPLVGASTRPVWMDNIDVTLTLRLTSRTTLFFYGLGNQGRTLSERIGVAQSVSNIEAPTSWRLYEAFIEHVTANDRLSLLIGLYDLNSEFDVLQAAELFLNSSFGIGPELANSRPQGPSIFPVTTVGLRVRLGFPLTSRKAGYLQLVLLDGAPGHTHHQTGTSIVFGRNDGLLGVAEIGTQLYALKRLADWSPIRWVSRLHEPAYHRKLALGFWYYTARFQWLYADRWQRGNWGGYLLAESRLYTAGTRTLWAFLRIGFAHPQVNRFGAYTGGGFSGQGWLPGRPNDRMGLALAAAHNSRAYRRLRRQPGSRVHHTEWILEGTYLLALSATVQLQLDLQWVQHPDTRAGSVLIGGLRLRWHP